MASLTVNCSEAEKQAVRAQAEAKGLTASSYLYGLIVEHVPGVRGAGGKPPPARLAQNGRTDPERFAMPPRGAYRGGFARSNEEMCRDIMGDPAPGRSALDRRQSP